MESRLDNIFRSTFRHAESTDTWMGIRREEPRDDPHRKKNDDEQKKEKPRWEDNTVVSIAALKQFLATLIAPDSTFQQIDTSLQPETAGLSAQQQRAHNAASAYQSTARHVTKAPAVTAPVNKPSPVLSQDENRTIHQLVNDLDLLLQNGITSLTIQKEGSFLESLTQAARSTLEAIT